MANDPGDIDIRTLKIGDLDLTDPLKAKGLEINIVEDILRPVLIADVHVLDENDALGQVKLNGGEDAEISFQVPGGQTATFKFKMFENANLDDKSLHPQGSMKNKEYQLRMVSPEYFKNRAKHIQKSFKQATHQTVKDVLKEISDKEVETPDETKGEQRLIANYQPAFEFLKNIHDRHVSQQHKSSLYTLFPSRNGSTETLKFATFEYLMSQDSGKTFKQDATVGNRTSTEGNTMEQLLWVKVPQSFHTPPRWNSASNERTYNMLTGKNQTKQRPNDKDFKILGEKAIASKDEQNWNSVPEKQMPRRDTHVSIENDEKRTDVSEARVNRAAYIAHLQNNAMKFEIFGDPSIKVGDVVTLNIPKKADADQESGETQMNDKVLITRIRHRIRGSGDGPRYTMVIEAVKAGFKEGVN